MSGPNDAKEFLDAELIKERLENLESNSELIQSKLTEITEGLKLLEDGQKLIRASLKFISKAGVLITDHLEGKR